MKDPTSWGMVPSGMAELEVGIWSDSVRNGGSGPGPVDDRR